MTTNQNIKKAKPWYSGMIAKPATPCDTCTVGDWGACYHAEYGRCKYANAKLAMRNFITGIVLFVSSAIAAHAQEIGYLVTIDKGAKEIEIYRLDSIAVVDALVTLNFRKIASGFAADQLANSRHFQIITNEIEFYVEKKRIVGRKQNGELKFGNLKSLSTLNLKL